ncbi:MAG: GGDEF-domain containing protein [Sphingomonadales bacterium 32-68-7]|nr:MAG: GGDEF-domain containing protein [Sphingomonadales bacterium 12-68-11]OYX08146.1 MAG: GGDEF-domain containing protein [Sphingomonadales bacterium 32-68-7]
MHGMLRRLADGDLDFEVEKFRLRELEDLSRPLEIFRRNAQAVQNLALTDPSTGMPNRRAFLERTGARLADAAAKGGPRHLLMLVDVDRFKHVNDDFGHAAGDRVVKLIGERMTETLGPGALVARLGGDEFALCLPLDGEADGSAVASRLVAAIRPPFDLGTYAIAVTISVGTVEAAPADAVAIEELLHRADLALYAAKNGGRNRALGFAPELEEDRELDRALERDLARALLGGQLRMVYQPILPLHEADPEVEALIRWEHPELGDISPARFIPAAERSGLMVQLGNWIIERTLSDLTRWPGIALSINLSPLQLQQDGFVPFLLDRCRHHAISPRRVILEVTESLSIENNSRALLTLELLRNAGFRIALDDFGTGYSSLSMLKTFKFDRLKIDRSLIDDLASDSSAQAVFEAAVTMALRIGAQVVAEGISDEKLIAPVLAAGCTHLQGFHCSRPIEADAVAAHFKIREVAAGDPASGQVPGTLAA